ncbi:MAG: hypothetical protein MR051_03510 [Lentisphaeria bacterium]|nr:hypothetical protein [Lentisphaeria bacterium]
MLNKKFFLMLAALCAGSAMAAVDSAASYFTVSDHNVPIGTPVELKIHLFDATGEPVEAKNITVRVPAGVAVVSQPEAAGEPGVYTAKVKADKAVDADITVRADGVVVEENILPAGGGFETSVGVYPDHVSTYANSYDHSYFGWDDRDEHVFRGKRSLCGINFDKTKSIYWSISAVSGDYLLKDRVYIWSCYARYSNVHGERGVNIQVSQRTADDKPVTHKYSAFHAGDSDGWVKLTTEPIKPEKESGVMSASAMNLAAGGELNFDCARLLVRPTLRWGDFPAARVVSKVDVERCRLYPGLNYANALKKDLETCKAELKEAIKVRGKEDQGVVAYAKSILKWQSAMKSKLDAFEAYNIQLEMEKATKELKKTGAASAGNELDALLNL